MTRDAAAIIERLRTEIERVGWSETARRAGVDRISLHRTFGRGAHRSMPSFTTVTRVADALGVRLSAR